MDVLLEPVALGGSKCDAAGLWKQPSAEKPYIPPPFFPLSQIKVLGSRA